MQGFMHFSRSLALAVGMALASSCLGMIASLAGRAGWWLLPAIGASLLLALAVAHAIGRLARRFPSALGVRTYIKAAFGNAPSLFFVLLYLVMIVCVAAVESNLYADIVQQVVPAVPAGAALVGVFAVVFAINALGHEASRQAQLALVASMLLGLAALSVCGVAHPAAVSWPPAVRPGQLDALPTAIVSAFFLFVGFEWVTSSQPPSRKAAAQLPRVLLVAVALLGGVYLLFASAALLQLSPEQLAGTRTPQLVMAARLWGPAGGWAMLLLSTAAVLMSFNAGVLGAARLVYGLGREGCLPRWLTRTQGAQAVPLAAIGLTVTAALCGSLAACALHLTDLLGSVAAVLIALCYAGLMAASLVLARREPRGSAPAARGIETAALAAMALLLTAMAFDTAARPGTLLAAGVCLACSGAAGALHRRTRTVSTSTGAPLRGLA
jgi:amino acid transporter